MIATGSVGVWLAMWVAMLAGTVPQAAALESPVTMLICRENDGCEAERAWLAARQPGLILVLDDNSAHDAFLAEDAGTVFAREIESAEYAVQDRRWGRALSHLDAANTALENWPGTVENHLLVRMHLLRGVALRHRNASGWEVAFRQAAAMAWNAEPDTRGIDAADQFALDTERRKLITSGTGTLTVAGSSTWWLDGVAVSEREISVVAGAHRLTAVEPGKLRTFSAVVPILPDVGTTVVPNWGPTDDAAWLLAELSVGVATLSADASAMALLSDWCVRNEVAVLGLAEIEEVRVTSVAPKITQSLPHSTRPPAAAGEVLMSEDSIPATFEATVAAQAEAAGQIAPPQTEYRLRSVFFDANTRRISSEPGAIKLANTDESRRFSLGVRVGWMRLSEREHGTVDLAAAWRLTGGFGVRAEAGLAVADSEYLFYDDWQDNKLMHAAVLGTWVGEARVAPLFGAGIEVYAPLSVGGLGELGVRAVFDQVWVAEATGRFGVGVAGGEAAVLYGAGLGLARRW